jgi:hypothetical protein
MAARADLVEFVRTGELGPVHLGLRPEEVERILGPPEGIDDTGRIWFYRSLEVTILEGDAKLIVVELYDPPTRFPRTLDVDVAPFVPGADSETIKQALDDTGVPWHVDEAWTIDGFQLTLASGAGVAMVFTGERRIESVYASSLSDLA